MTENGLRAIIHGPDKRDARTVNPPTLEPFSAMISTIYMIIISAEI